MCVSGLSARHLPPTFHTANATNATTNATRRHIPEYAAFYTCGNLISIAASAFFVGPRRQLKLMCEPVRRVACAIFIGTMILTLVMALTYPVPLLLIVMLVVQYCALIWYGASFIYGGRTCLKAAIKKASVWCVKLMNS